MERTGRSGREIKINFFYIARKLYPMFLCGTFTTVFSFKGLRELQEGPGSIKTPAKKSQP
jgi:hypothetical protein